jgi:hypothetical protein
LTSIVYFQVEQTYRWMKVVLLWSNQYVTVTFN